MAVAESWPARPQILSRSHPPLVLAYHGLGSYERALDPHNLMVRPEQFVTQVRVLRGRGYRFLTLTEFAAQVQGGVGPHGSCALTFDDGTTDNLTVLAPLAAELGVPVTIFVCPGLLGRAHFAMPPAAGVSLMDADELRDLADRPLVEIGSHTSTHVDLSAAAAPEAYREMATSRDSLEDLLQRPVTSFAYPGCSYSAACPDAAQEAGYRVAVTCGPRGGWRAFELTRESVDSLDGRLMFALKSRRLFWPLRDSLPGRGLRLAGRRLRHGRGT